MVVAFLDTSALVRRYDRLEPGAARVQALCLPSRRNTLLVARITAVELAAALARRERDESVSSREAGRLWQLFLGHWRSQYRVLFATETVYAEAERLLFRYPLRAAPGGGAAPEGAAARRAWSPGLPRRRCPASGPRRRALGPHAGCAMA
jgi:hypothetical protein